MNVLAKGPSWVNHVKAFRSCIGSGGLGHIYFRANARSVDKRASPADFTVTVNGVGASLDDAREAGRYEGIRFCIRNFGSSKIEWKVGPDSEPQTLRIENDKLTFAGKCQRP